MRRSLSASLQTIAEREAVLLAPYALHSADSRGRKYDEPAHLYRGPYQRDRDRILHSWAFRRLSGKMQVFTGDMGDYHRTRLTHTQEVASIARTIGRALRLNEDYIEAVALLHDIGHPPFGHAGEEALDACLSDGGGFSHNRHALTIVEQLENRYPGFPGLNLTREVLSGQAWRADKTGPPRLEDQVVDLADHITYTAHDVDDAVKLNLVSLDDLFTTSLCAECGEQVRAEFRDLDAKMMRKLLVHQLLDCQVGDVLQTSSLRLAESNPASSHEAQAQQVRLGASERLVRATVELGAFLYERVYRHPSLIDIRGTAQSRIQAMFAGFLGNLEMLPPTFRARADEVGPRRAVGDYLAGMTDRYCDELYQRHFHRDTA